MSSTQGVFAGYGWCRERLAQLRADLGAQGKRRRRSGQRFRPGIEQLEDRTVFNTGGGFTDSGILGAYYANITNPTDWLNNMANYTPAFSRTDVRIDFTNSTKALTSSPGGDPQDVNFAAVGNTNFAVKWSGSFIPRYTEIYTFKTITDDGVVLKINGNTVINDFTYHAPTTDTVAIALTAGTSYSIEMDYFQGGGGWNAQLHWLSADQNPSEPGYFAEEVIEPATPVGVNYVVDPKEFADAVKFAGYTNATTTNPTDGWPTEDFQLTLFYNGGEYGQDDAGTYLLQFNGEAQVTDAWGPTLDFKVGGTDYGATLPVGAGFNGTTTTATVTIPDVSPWGQMHLGFTQTQRDGGGAGVTAIHLMRPTTLGGTTDYAVGTLLTNAGLAEAAPFTTLRMMDWTNTINNTEANWSDRALPSVDFWQQTSDGSMPWETAVAVANATGKDLYINIPVEASNAYITDLADLFKYGSDGVNPYTSTQANPVWAPLNPNLNVYIEFGNEVWNWGSAVPYNAMQAAEQAAYDYEQGNNSCLGLPGRPIHGQRGCAGASGQPMGQRRLFVFPLGNRSHRGRWQHLPVGLRGNGRRGQFGERPHPALAGVAVRRRPRRRHRPGRQLVRRHHELVPGPPRQLVSLRRRRRLVR